MNIVLLHGKLSADAQGRELANGEVSWSLELVTPVAWGNAAVTVVWNGTAPAAGWATGAELVVSGTVRRRFFRSGGATQSRTEVLAAFVGEVGRGKPFARQLARASGALGAEEVATLRSVVASR